MEHDFLSAFIVLLIVTDPLGNVPLVISLLRNVPRERRLKVITRECLIATVMLLLFMLVGERLLAAMHLTNVSLEIAGGVILFLDRTGHGVSQHGCELCFPGIGRRADAGAAGHPLIAGPSALATVVLLASRQPDHAWSWTAAIVLAMTVGWVVLASADRLSRRLGPSGLVALERFMGLLLSAMAVEMLISGLHRAFPAMAPVVGGAG